MEKKLDYLIISDLPGHYSVMLAEGTSSLKHLNLSSTELSELKETKAIGREIHERYYIFVAEIKVTSRKGIFQNQKVSNSEDIKFIFRGYQMKRKSLEETIQEIREFLSQ